MKPFFKILAALFFLAAFPNIAPAQTNTREVDRIVAIVGNEAITLSELNQQIQSATLQLKRQNTPVPPQDVLTRQMLEYLITTKAQILEAKSIGLATDDTRLEQVITQIAANNKMTLEQFKASLKNEGYTYARFKESIRDEITISRLRDQEVGRQIIIPDAEVDNFLAQVRAYEASQEEYRVAHILMRAPESASSEQLRQLRAKAEDVLKQAQNGRNFAELSAAYSDAPDALQGGDMGWRTLSRLPALFAEALPKMAENGLSDILRSPNGFHIIKLLAKRGTPEKTEEPAQQQTHARHILIRIDEITSEAEARRRLSDLLERINHGENFSELARLYSQDASAANGGDLGWISPGDTVPDFEKAMNALENGQVSGIVQSPFGFHLIRVEERRPFEAGREKQRAEARQALHERKMDEAYQDWLRQLRDRTYIEYRLDEE